MSRVMREIQINSATKKVWDVLSNIGAVQDYSPGVLKSYFTSEIKEGRGASRHCDLFPKGTVEERIVAWSDGEQYEIEIFEGEEVPYMGIAIFSLKSIGARTSVTEIMDYVPTNQVSDRLIGKPMDRLVGKVVEGNLIGLKHYIETGEIVTQEVYKKIRNSSQS